MRPITDDRPRVRRSNRLWASLSVVPWLFAACVGQIIDPPGVGGNGGPGGPGSPGSPGSPDSRPTTPPTPSRCVAPAVGPSPMRRLTHREYDNTVRDLLGDTAHPARTFPDDTLRGLFDNTAAALTVPVLLAEKYLEAAEALSAAAVRNMPALLACDTAARGEATCAREFVERFGRRAFRRPLAPEEVTGLVGLYDRVRAATDFTNDGVGRWRTRDQGVAVDAAPTPGWA